MKKADKLRYDELCKLINYHNELYYNQDSPEIDDYEYDMLHYDFCSLCILILAPLKGEAPRSKIN